jgi:hypothetical protein
MLSPKVTTTLAVAQSRADELLRSLNDVASLITDVSENVRRDPRAKQVNTLRLGLHSVCKDLATAYAQAQALDDDCMHTSLT